MARYYCQRCGRVVNGGSRWGDIVVNRALVGCTVPDCPLKAAMRQDAGRSFKILFVLPMLGLFVIVGLAVLVGIFRVNKGATDVAPPQLPTSLSSPTPAPVPNSIPPGSFIVTLQRPAWPGGVWLFTDRNGRRQATPDALVGPAPRKLMGDDRSANFVAHFENGSLHLDRRVDQTQ